MITAALLAATLLLPGPGQPPGQPRDPWFAEDKLKHFVASFVVTSLTVSGARLAGADHDTSIWIGVGVTATAGVAKEFRDVRRQSIFSYRDLLWDIAGITAAAAMADNAR